MPIGRNVHGSHDIIEERKASGPNAVLTPFGWCVAGPIPKHSMKTQKPRVNLVKEAEADAELRDYVSKMWEDEKFTFKKPGPVCMSHEEKKALNMLQKTIRYP